MMKDGCRNESIDQLLKGLLLGLLPFLVSNMTWLFTVLKPIKQGMERSCYSREIKDKTAIKIAKT